jgi:L-asparaginase
MIALLFTGGTISMRFDPASGGAVPALSGRDILVAAGDVGDVTVELEDWGAYPGPHMTAERQWALRGRIAELLDRPDVRGVVLTHGTDTLEESAYLVARSLASPKPVVFTGAMRAASDPGWDGPANLRDAIRVATAPEASGLGTLVTLGGRVWSALDVTKSHTHAPDAFVSPELGPVAEVDDGRVLVRRRPAPAPEPILPDALGGPVDVVVAHAGADARLLDASRRDAAGVVVAALGRGNVPPAMVPGIERWVADGKPVVIASRAGSGRVGHTYAYPGGGRRLAALGAMFAGWRRPQQARLELMLALGAGLDDAALRALFAS